MAVRFSDASDDESVVAKVLSQDADSNSDSISLDFQGIVTSSQGGTFDEDDADMVLSSHPVPLNLPLLTYQQGALFCY